MSDVENKDDKPEASDMGVSMKESRVRHAEKNEDEVVPNKVAKLDEVKSNEDEDLPSDEEDEEEEPDDDYDEEEEDVDLDEDVVVDEVNDDDNILDDSGDSEEEDEIDGSIASMKECQVEIDQLTQKANDEILKVEQKYNRLRKPAYLRRNKYIRKLHGFWADVFSHHPELKRVLTKEDIRCFRYLNTIELDDLESPRTGFSIKFNFSPNPYFTNSSIIKDYMLPWNESPSCKCTEIHWKPSMNLTHYNTSSFFSWFCSQEDASTDDIAEIIKEELWTNPVSYYDKARQEGDEVGSGSDVSDEDEEIVTEEAPVYVTDESAAYISSEEEEEWERKTSGGKHGKGTVNQEPEQYVIDDEEEDDDDFLEDEDDEDDEDDVIVEDDDDEEEVEEKVVQVTSEMNNDDEDDDEDDVVDDEDEGSPMKNHTGAEEDPGSELEDSDDGRPENDLNGSMDAAVEEILKEPSTAGA